jgi:peptide/nickel transport system substrate-binding protein
LSRYLRWQAAIALLGILLLAALLSYATYNFTTVTVPDRGGTFVEGVAGNPQYLNPVLSQNNEVDSDLCALLFNGLSRFDGQGNVVPDLAQGWTVSADGLKYDFKLKEGLYWHDGAPVTAADVLYTTKVMQDPDFPGMGWLGVLWRTVKVSAPGGPTGLTVHFELSAPLASFLDYTTIGLLPAHLWERVPASQLKNSQLNTHPVGTGPFQLVDLTATRAELIPNPRYPGGFNPYLTGLTIRFYPDHQSLLPAFDRKEIDGVSAIAPDDMPAAAERNDLQLFSSPLPGYSLVYLNLQNPNVPFFKELAVRQALLYALDRQGLIDSVLHGQGIVANSPIQPNTWAYDANVPKYAYDLDKARKLLDDAGWKDTDGDGVRDQNGVKLAFVLVGSSANQALIDAIAAAWGRLGVQVAAQPVSMAGLTTDFLTTHNFDAALVDWSFTGDPDPYPLWHSAQIKDGQNYGGWDNPEADAAIEKARALTDRAARQGYYVQFQRIFAQEVPAILLYHPVYTYGVRAKMHNVQIGLLNSAGDRFRDFAHWYIVTKRITVGNNAAVSGGTPQFDSPLQ